MDFSQRVNVACRFEWMDSFNDRLPAPSGIMSATTANRRVLAITDSEPTAPEILSRLGDDIEIVAVASAEDAVQFMEHGSYDLIVADASVFDQLAHLRDVERHAFKLLETMGQGACIYDACGTVLWANPKMKAFPDDLFDKIIDSCHKTFDSRIDQAATKPAHMRARQFCATAGTDRHFDVTVTPIADLEGTVQQYSALVVETTHSTRLQKKIDAIDMAGRELVRLDLEDTSGMSADERLRLLENKILRYLHDLLHFDNFAVLLIEKKSNRLEMVLQHGMSEEGQNLKLSVDVNNNGISGYVAETGRSYICHDTHNDPRYLLGLETARSSLTVPLRLHDKIIGVLDLESDEPAAFNEDDRQFAEMLGRYVAMALNMLDLLIIERYESTGKLADDVIEEIGGPLNDIVTEAGNIMEEYIGNDDLRNRLHAIIDNAKAIKDRVRDVANPEAGIRGRYGVEKTSDPLLSGKTVLIADDEEIIRETIGGVLRGCGCTVQTAVNGADAIEQLEAQSFDLVLADIKMPHKTGYEVFAAARDRSPQTAVILMTGFGYDPHHSIVRARKDGLNAVLFKPFKVDQLLAEIRTALQPAS